MSQLLDIRRVSAFAFRYPIRTPVQTSFGTMRDRPAVFVEIEDRSGAVGWGEIWCNFPSVAAEHRCNIVAELLRPLLQSKPFVTPREAFDFLTETTRVLAIQSGEAGPIAQSIAGIDIALWDLFAKKRSISLWSLLGGQTGQIAVYASGINPTSPVDVVARYRALGHRTFKLKVGFSDDGDVSNVAAIRDRFARSIDLAVDANQAWQLSTAQRMADRLRDFDLCWLEEPLRADVAWEEWRALSRTTDIPIAAGENIAGERAFRHAIESKALGVLQPDLAKWGGFSGCSPVSRSIRDAGLRFCPHFLGGGIGLVASAHLLAAAGGDGLLEIDSNDNPLREYLAGPLSEIRDGRAQLSDKPGLGFEPDLRSIHNFCVLERR
jgi:D-galactarolactone cycloisomerase